MSSRQAIPAVSSGKSPTENAMTYYILILFAVVTCQATPYAFAATEAAPHSQSEEYRIGVMVIAVAAAIKAPEKAESLETIARYGTLTAHYVMIRGWLAEELRGVESQWQATRETELKAQHELKVLFLRRAIRRIDLE